MAFGLISFFVVAVVGVVLMREPPGEAAGRPPAGEAVRQRGESAPSGGEASSGGGGLEWTLRRALRTSPIWTISLAWVFLATCIHFVGTHFIALIVGIGHPALLASSVLAVSGALSIVNRVVGGGLSDKIGRVKTFVSGAGLAAVGSAILFFHQTPETVWDLYVFAVLFGLGIGAMTGLTTALGSDMYRGPHFGAILGFMTIGFGLGGALGPLLGGFIFELTGSYRAMLAYVTLALCCASLSFISAGRAIRKHKKLSQA